MRVLILGGYGTFGGRLAELLCDEAALELVVAGRSLAKAEGFCRALGGACARRPLQLDRNGNLKAILAEVRPDLLVDASGPFQAYGERPYRVVEACIAAGVDYLDLADDSAFVDGISSLDAAARAAGVFALAGVSSFPVLTAAVVRRLTDGLAQVDEIHGGIAPSPHARVGPNVMRAVTSYAGRPVRLRRDGQDTVGAGLAETLRFTVAPPGRLPLRPVLFSLVDVPDLRVLPGLWPGVRTVWMGAGPTPQVLHEILIALARLVRLNLLPPIGWAAPFFHWVNGWLRWGEHRGGMFVRVRGRTSDGAAVQRSWHLLAEGEDGPMIPSMAAEGLVRRAMDDRRPAPGARPCVSELELSDYDDLFARRRIYTGLRQDPPQPGTPLFKLLLGDAWKALPAPIRAMHDVARETSASGRADVERGHGPFAAMLAACIGAPRAGRDQPLRVTFHPDGRGETWTRTFAGRHFRSRQEPGRGRFEGLVVERFGPVAVGLALVLDAGRLNLVVRGWSLFGVPMPAWLGPAGEAFESAEGGVFRFEVDIRHRLFGRIVSYRGCLQHEDA